MKANELRIGNLINIDDCLTKITGVSKSIVFFNDGFQMFIAGGIEPIPLTEEWLLKFGFEEKQHDSDQCFGHVLNDFWVMNESQIRVNYGGYILFDFKIEFVHQLQNLYFALTGEELLPIGGRLT